MLSKNALSRIAKCSVVVLVVAVALAVLWSPHRQEIQPGEYLDVQALGTLYDLPIAGVRRVDEDGQITLGPAYGRVAVAGLNVDAATKAITVALHKTLKEPHVSVERLGKDATSWLEVENRRLAAENFLLRTAPRGVTSNGR